MMQLVDDAIHDTISIKRGERVNAGFTFLLL
jgi:hypothetical protein